MALTLDEVRAFLEPEEPDYPGAARKLGADALPHLERLITGDHTGLAAKAAYLAGMVGTDQCLPALQKAARSSQPEVRVAAAAAARHLPANYNEVLLTQLVGDVDHGVTKVALRSAPPMMSDSLRQMVDAANASMKSSTPARVAKKKSAAKKSAAKKTSKKSAAKKQR